MGSLEERNSVSCPQGLDSPRWKGKRWNRKTNAHSSRILTNNENAYIKEFIPPNATGVYDIAQDFEEEELDEEEIDFEEDDLTSDWAGEQDGGYDIGEIFAHEEAEPTVALTLYGHFLHEDTYEDYMWTSVRNIRFLDWSGIHMNTRALLVDWMMKVQQYTGFPTHFLFMAVELLDFYASLNVVPLCDYQLLACTAQKMVLDFKPQYTLSRAAFAKATDHAYTSEQIRKMAFQIMNVVGVFRYTPNPYNYLSVCFQHFEILSPPLSRAECFLMCRYILELGLTETRLVPYPAIIRCCGAIYLLRRILQQRFIARNQQNRSQIVIEFPLWPNVLARNTGVHETHHLKIVAYYYGRQLAGTRMLIRRERLEDFACFLTAHRKYSHHYYRGIPNNPLLLSFRLSSVFPREEVEAIFSFPPP